jgi:hypothetical protein
MVIKFDDGNCETDLCSSESFPSAKKQMIMQAMIFQVHMQLFLLLRSLHLH